MSVSSSRLHGPVPRIPGRCCSTSRQPDSTRQRVSGSASASANLALTGTAVLLVDHDIALVLAVCDRIYVLDFGVVIAEGDPAAIRADQALADAYPGQISRDVSRDGMGDALECVGLTGGWGTLTAFRDVDLAIEPGTIHAILGPNGAGKTTLLHTLAGLLPAHSGTVAVSGVKLDVVTDRDLQGGTRLRTRQSGAVHHPVGRRQPSGRGPPR